MDVNRQWSKKSDSIPNRWLKCPPKSYEFLVNKFLVFKTPLSSQYDDQVQDDIFQVRLVFQSMKNKRVKLGLWIDLTNTSRYYDRKEVEEHDCRYVKLQCEGHGSCPTEEQANSFTELCYKFIRQYPLEAIGVHCTHGFNRSGFMLVSYLVQIMDWDLGAAVAEFARIRPPGIYKEDYLMELRRRYDPDFTPKVPPLPDWCFAEQTVPERPREDEEDEPHRVHAYGPKRLKTSKKNPVFMEGISGVEPICEPLLSQIQEEVRELCRSKSQGFPGCQPVSLGYTNIDLLSKKPYSVSWKADGVRYMMYIKGKNEVYCIDRDNCVFLVKNLVFPFKKNLEVHIKNTLLDGEMVIDKVGGASIPRYLVYDIISIMSYHIGNDEFDPKRIKTITREIIEPRASAMEKGLINRQEEPFSVRLKEFLHISQARKYLSENFRRSLSHSPDGLIFQPSLDPYTPGRCKEVLKWKPLSLNTVDFRLKIRTESGEGILTRKIGELYVGGQKTRFGCLASIKNVKDLDSKIIECSYENGKWVFLRERTDKSFPNSYETAQGVLDTIARPITEEYLLDYIRYHPYVKPDD